MSISIEKQIETLGPWFHNLHLKNGLQTVPDHPLGDFPNFKWMEIKNAIPEDLNGWTVLDIGCNAGFYSFELARRGALVTAIDIDDHYLTQAFWAADYFGLSDRIRFNKKQVYDLSKSKVKYDLVWYMGVFYHLRYPFLSLDIVNRITRKMMVFQSMTIPAKGEENAPEDITLDQRKVFNEIWWPKMAFIEKKIDGDPTNWWVPNSSCIKAMLRASGFRVINEPSHEVFVCEVDNNEVRSGDLRELEYRAATGLKR